ncbi:LOW QUALITY PROTEIN: hypothetical protein OSB04_020137 [Centaurea solstitialis]|uniref:Uncharacterized protein n=1 Tax=Centaurea solstitialis TaxID=347529 RepID=A0AA38WEY3_9ASTR|nr:LOW QUALITY PROTEIN: hypothetical protein OSB04_020137 [Centaurea solstitialis]
MWLLKLLGYEISCSSYVVLSLMPPFFCDNGHVSSIYPVQQQRTKHVEIDLHFVREHVAIGHYAAIFTKGLPTSLFLDFRNSLNIHLPPDQTTGPGFSCEEMRVLAFHKGLPLPSKLLPVPRVPFHFDYRYPAASELLDFSIKNFDWLLGNTQLLINLNLIQRQNYCLLRQTFL